jgi:integrase
LGLNGTQPTRLAPRGALDYKAFRTVRYCQISFRSENLRPRRVPIVIFALEMAAAGTHGDTEVLGAAVKKTLTDSYLRSAPAPKVGRIEIADLRCVGLSFRITPNVRSWNYRFRGPKSGKTTRIGLGAYPAVSLAQAREQADAMRGVVATGKNPISVRREEREDAPRQTFEALAERYLAEHADRKKRSAPADRRNLNLHILPRWRSRRYDELRRADLVELVEGLIGKGKPTLANRVHSLCSKIGGFAVEAGLLAGNPFAQVPKRGVEQIGRRVLSDDEIRLFWRLIVLPPVSRRVGLALRLALLTGARAGEVAGIKRSELEYLDEPERTAWIVSGDRVKNGRAHYLPLAELSRDTIRSALELIADDQAFLLPSRSKKDTSVTAHALAVAMKRFAKKLSGSGTAVKSWRADPPTPHDLRRTLATRLSQLGVAKEDRDAVLNHVRSDVGSKHYDLYERRAEKFRALTAWNDDLAAMLHKVGAEEVPLVLLKKAAGDRIK